MDFQLSLSTINHSTVCFESFYTKWASSNLANQKPFKIKAYGSGDVSILSKPSCVVPLQFSHLIPHFPSGMSPLEDSDMGEMSDFSWIHQLLLWWAASRWAVEALGLKSRVLWVDPHYFPSGHYRGWLPTDSRLLPQSRSRRPLHVCARHFTLWCH